jgi:hypothetical protein
MSKKRFFLLLLLTQFNHLIAQDIAKTIHQKGMGTNAEAFQSISPDGGWCWFSDPRAVYFEGKHKRTYTGWITSSGDIVVGFYDHDTREIKTKVIYEKLEVDDHDNPAILIGKDGKLKVFFSKHARNFPIQLYHSSKSEDISDWETPRSLYLNDTVVYKGLSNTYTYYNPVYLSEENRYYLFWRGTDFKPNYSVSDDGVNWSKGKILVLPDRIYRERRPYMKVSSDDRRKIHFAFTDGHPHQERNNSIYYMYYEKGGLYKADGRRIKNVGEPVRPDETDVVYDAYKDRNPKAWIWDIAQDKNGRPTLVYVKFPDSAKHVYCHARFDGKKWINQELVNGGKYFVRGPVGMREREPNYSGGLVIDHDDPSILYLSVNRDSVFEIEKWTSIRNGKNWKVEALTRGSKNDNIRPFAVRNADKGNAFQVLWLTNFSYVHYTKFHSAIKMDLPAR